MWVKWLPFLAGGGGRNGAETGVAPPPPPQPLRTTDSSVLISTNALAYSHQVYHVGAGGIPSLTGGC